MNCHRIQVRMPSGFITPWHADTIFGHLCWTAERHGGFSNFSGAAEFINLFRSGTPPLILSDGFPSGLLPAPVTLRERFDRAETDSLTPDSYSHLKKIKELSYLTEAQFAAWRRGETFDLPETIPNPVVSTVTLHNQIDRFTNTTGGDGGALFEQEEKFLRTETGGLLSIYARIATGLEDDVRRLFELTAAGGFGKKRTTGKGAFSIEEFELYEGFDAMPSGQGTGVVLLSHVVPARTDPTDGAWRVMVKYGKLGEEKTFCGNPFKKPLIMLKPGAVFRTDAPRPWYGRLVEKIAYADDDVVQYGFGFSVSVALTRTA